MSIATHVCSDYPLEVRAQPRARGTAALALGYSGLLALGLVLSAPWWLFRMAIAKRYREGLCQRLGVVPKRLRRWIAGRRVLWVHAVSVGEVIAVSPLVEQIDEALNGAGREGGEEPWTVLVSTTTRTGQALARKRFGDDRVFYFPLDFGLAVRAYLRVLRPAMLILAESELWPRMLHECKLAGVPVAVVNARMSDRSFRRARRVRVFWRPVLRHVNLWLAQSAEDARRLQEAGATPGTVHVSGNLKYDVRPRESDLAALLEPLLERRQLVAAGSLVEGEEQLLLDRWWMLCHQTPQAILLLAPRHPERFEEVATLVGERMTLYRASALRARAAQTGAIETLRPHPVLLLDTVGDLASLYALASVAFVGGSLVRKGGHNPLEPARFGVPVLMGPSFENFRDVVARLKAEDGICIVRDGDELVSTIAAMLADPERARALGERGRKVFEREGGATARSIEALMPLVLGHERPASPGRLPA